MCLSIAFPQTKLRTSSLPFQPPAMGEAPAADTATEAKAITFSPSATLLSPPPPPPPTKESKLPLAIILISYLLSLPLLAFSLWLLFTRDARCEGPLDMPNLRAILGVGLLAVFAISNFTVHYGERVLLPGALVLTVPLLMMVILGLALEGKYSSETRSLPGSPLWFLERVEQSQVWDGVKSCIYDQRTCADLAFHTVGLGFDEFSTQKLNSIESGCCKPPDLCHMEYVNATYWKHANLTRNGSNSTSGSNSTTISTIRGSGNWRAYKFFGDCHMWNNNFTQLCYDCESCKQGFVSIVHKPWRRTGVFLIVMAVLIVFIQALRFMITMCEHHRSYKF